jgi:hypothetical protein
MSNAKEITERLEGVRKDLNILEGEVRLLTDLAKADRDELILSTPVRRSRVVAIDSVAAVRRVADDLSEAYYLAGRAIEAVQAIKNELAASVMPGMR